MLSILHLVSWESSGESTNNNCTQHTLSTKCCDPFKKPSQATGVDRSFMHCTACSLRCSTCVWRPLVAHPARRPSGCCFPVSLGSLASETQASKVVKAVANHHIGRINAEQMSCPQAWATGRLQAAAGSPLFYLQRRK